jgi:hypothetical protein
MVAVAAGAKCILFLGFGFRQGATFDAHTLSSGLLTLRACWVKFPWTSDVFGGNCMPCFHQDRYRLIWRGFPITHPPGQSFKGSSRP